MADGDGIPKILKRWLGDLALATAFLTRLPVPFLKATRDRTLTDASWSFPLVGLIVGGGGAVALLIGFQLGLHPLVCGLLAIGTQVLITGALHEDGLADVADGFGGGGKISDKLRIMRDSRIGTYGVLALVFSVGIRAGTVSGMMTPTMAVLALLVAGALSRGLVVVAMGLLDMVRTDGLAAGAGRPGREEMLVALAIALVTAFLLLGAAGWMVLVSAVVAAAVMGWLSKRQIGGQTGDVLGAVQQVTEAAVLISVVAVA